MIYEVDLWPGYGYGLYAQRVTADSDEQALEIACANIIKNKYRSFYLTTEEVDELAESDGQTADEYAEEAALCYVDGTMEGAPFPVYVALKTSGFVLFSRLTTERHQNSVSRRKRGTGAE